MQTFIHFFGLIFICFNNVLWNYYCVLSYARSKFMCSRKSRRLIKETMRDIKGGFGHYFSSPHCSLLWCGWLPDTSHRTRILFILQKQSDLCEIYADFYFFFCLIRSVEYVKKIVEIWTRSQMLIVHDCLAHKFIIILVLFCCFLFLAWILPVETSLRDVYSVSPADYVKTQ